MEEQSRREGRQGQGEVEVAVNDMAGMVRTLRYGLLRNTETCVETGCPTLLWFVEYSGFVLTRLTVGEDGQPHTND